MTISDQVKSLIQQITKAPTPILEVIINRAWIIHLSHGLSKLGPYKIKEKESQGDNVLLIINKPKK